MTFHYFLPVAVSESSSIMYIEVSVSQFLEALKEIREQGSRPFLGVDVLVPSYGTRWAERYYYLRWCTDDYNFKYEFGF